MHGKLTGHCSILSGQAADDNSDVGLQEADYIECIATSYC